VMELSAILVKRIAAAVLCVCFFLPIASCNPKAALPGEVQAGPINIAAYSSYEWPSIGSALLTVAFFGPAALQLIILRNSAGSKTKRFAIVEIISSGFCLISVTWLLLWGGSVRYGAFIAYSMAGAYFYVAINELRMLFKYTKPD